MAAITAQAYRIEIHARQSPAASQHSAVPTATFDRVDDQHYREAFTQGMAAQLREVAAITAQDAAPSFDTPSWPWSGGQQLDRAMAVFFNLNASNTNDVMQQLESELAPCSCARGCDCAGFKAVCASERAV